MKKLSRIWSISDEEFTQLIKESNRVVEVLRFFGLENKGANYKTIQRRVALLKLDTSHFMNRTQSSTFSNQKTKQEFIESWLTEKSNHNRGHLKQYLIKFNLLAYECQICNNHGEWNNKKLTLQLDHINGINNDNRVENLRFLCPNCHSQTTTFAGKQNKSKKIKKTRPTKINWPTPEQLQKMLWEFPTTKIAQELGVSDTAICQFSKKFKLTKPPRGYWSKLARGEGIEPNHCPGQSGE